MGLSFHSRSPTRGELAKERMRRSGITPRGRKLWSDKDDEILKTLYPSYAAMRTQLPERTLRALQARCEVLGITKKLHWWQASEVAKLRRLYPSASQTKLREEFPGLTSKAIERAAARNGIHRAKRRYKRTGSLPMDQILTRIEEIGWTLVDLDAESKTGRYFRSGCWRGCRPNFSKLAKAVRALDGELIVSWREYK